MSTQKILIVEDEPKIARLLSDYLNDFGYDTTICNDGSEATELFHSVRPDCVLLDVMLPNKDGLTVCREIRQDSMVPILIITARVDEIDRLLGLELGADDYICKPFSPREVVVRVRNILKRVSLAEPEHRDDRNALRSNALSDGVSYQGLFLDPQKFSCVYQGAPFTLTAVEFRMLYALASRPGCIFSRNQLMDAAYEDGRVVSDRTIDTHIKNIRKKLTLCRASSEQQGEFIHSIYGVGYKVE